MYILAMEKSCKQCGEKFEVTGEDLKFLENLSPVIDGEKFLLPWSVYCFECKWKRKMMWRNFNKFYKRKSDLSGKEFISVFSGDKQDKVYALAEWWGNEWSPLDYGMDFDSSKSFFEQMNELYNKVPRPGMFVSASENCDYTNATYFSKDCYLVAGCVENESCSYGHILWYSKNCFDMAYSYYCEGCYECTDCDHCYELFYGRECLNCSSGYYLFDCKGCMNCFGCTGLANKEFYIFNKHYSKDEYAEKIAELLKPENKEMVIKTFKDLYLSLPKRALYARNSENVFGNHIFNSRNAYYCFDIINSEDLRYCFTVGKMKNCMDCIHNGAGLELGYETLASCGYNLLFFRDGGGIFSNNSMYCNECYGVNDCFGCVGLHSKEQYCILNKKYSESEYKILVKKIIEHMRKTGEWGEFFPEQNSPFCYNETTAHDFYPMTKEDALKKGYKWFDEVDDADLAKRSGEDIVTCEVTGKQFRVIPQEVAFLKRHNLPVPSKCPDVRHKERMVLRNPRKLWDRKCAKCSREIKTAYAPDRPEIVYCEECYLKEVY